MAAKWAEAGPFAMLTSLMTLSGASESSHWIAAGDIITDYWAADAWSLWETQLCALDSSTEASTNQVPNDQLIAVTCCNDDGSKVFDDFDDGCVFGKTYEEAEAHCNEYRLCTLAEMLGTAKPEGDCNGGRFNWVSTECGADPEPELSHWIAAGDPTEWWDTAHTLKVCETDSTKTTSHAISIDDDEIAVTCCTDDGVKVVEQPGDGCLAQKSYEEAEAHCVDSGHRLCTLAEMLGSPKSDGDCNGARFNWVSTECGTEPEPEPESFHWIAAGDPTKWWNHEVFDTLRVCESDSAVSTSQAVPNSYDIAVTCCSDDGSKVFDGIDASDEGCVYQKSYEDAEAHCHIDGYRLCTLEEMLSSPKSDGDCNGGRFNWVSTECVPDAHLVVQGRISWGGWGAAPDSYCQLDDDNQAAYDSSKHDRNIGVGCCSMDGTTGYRPDCNAHPATYQEAVDLCSSTVKNGERLRLCTLQEMLYGKSNGRGITEGKGCWYDAAYQWVSDECDMGANAAAPMANEGSASDGEGRAFEFGDFLPMVLGAAAGIAVLSGVVVLVVATKRKRSAKKEETEMAKVVHVPETSPASVDGVETI